MVALQSNETISDVSFEECDNEPELVADFSKKVMYLKLLENSKPIINFLAIAIPTDGITLKGLGKQNETKPKLLSS